MVRTTALVAYAVAALSPLASAYTSLSNDTMWALPYPGDDFNTEEGGLLAPILIPRVPGTEGSEKVRQHFIDFFSKELPTWTISLQKSNQQTPLSSRKEVPFTNVILTRDPPGAKIGEVSYLTLVAHYDSKIEPEGFIGATDSAASCAMLMHIARSVDDAMTAKWVNDSVIAYDAEQLDAKKGVQILLLDGEEAFVDWKGDDNTYGARALAEDWENQAHPFYTSYRNPLDQIELFVLLDLLGASGPNIPSYFKTTHWAYRRFCEIEKRMHDLGVKRSSPNYLAKQQGLPESDMQPETPFFRECDKMDSQYWLGGMVGDDHMPFLQRGVEVLHMIPHPFPSVWHTSGDDASALDDDTTQDWAVMVSAFVAEWMDLEGFVHFVPNATRTPVKRATSPNSRDEL